MKAETGAEDVSVGMPLAGWQAIPEGEKLNVRFTIYRANDVELGLFLKPLTNLHCAQYWGTSSQWEWTGIR